MFRVTATYMDTLALNHYYYYYYYNYYYYYYHLHQANTR